MARTRRMPDRPVSNSLVASAAKIGSGATFKNFSRISQSNGWQREAWKFYHTIGEFRYGCDLSGAMISKATLGIGQFDGDVTKPVTSGPAVDLLRNFFGDTDGKSEMLKMMGIHLSVAGECFVLGYTDPETESDHWDVVASTMLKRNGDEGQWIVNNYVLDIDPEDVFVCRIWRPDPLRPDLAIAPARSLMTVLGEIARLTDHVAAQVDSRLAGAGILLMPSEMTFPAPQEVDGQPARSANTAEDLMVLIQEVMATSIEDRGNAAALVPIVITAPESAIASVKHMTFWTELDAQAIELRKEAIRRLAIGMDIPSDVLLGPDRGNHWAAYQADESAVKIHAEPLLKLITHALAVGYLRPMLEEDEGLSREEAAAFTVTADTSEMRLRPNRSKEALELYDRGELSGAALLRETGFDSTDQMEAKEQALWFLKKVASGSTTPDLVQAALEQLGVTLTPQASTATPAATGTEARPTPSLDQHPPARGIPDRAVAESRKEARDEGRVPSADPASRAALIAASEMVVVRALERAGNKLKTRMKVKPSCAATDIYRFVHADDADFLLEDAWAHVPALAARHDLPESVLIGHLSSYCNHLFTTQDEHTFEGFDSYLSANLREAKDAAA